MGATSEKLRNALESRGLWRDFCLLRDDAKKSGIAPSMARREAIKQIAPDLLAIAPPGKVGRPPKKKPAEESAEEPADDPVLDAAPPEEKPVEPVKAQRQPARQSDLPGDLDPSFFAGKKATVNASMQWVLSNVGFPLDKVDLRSAPSALAYSTLVLCQSSPSILNDIMRTTINKLLAKEDASNQYGGDDFDGKTEYDLASAVAGIVKGEG